MTADGELLPEPFLNIGGRMIEPMAYFDGRGLLGLAFHPDFSENGLFYLGYSRPLDPRGDLDKQLWWSHTDMVSEFRVSDEDPNKADLAYKRILSHVDWPRFNYNGH